ncbi:MAG: YggT family protein [Chloroflexota bacterium]|nr:MAG: YggT family protein [Chloroflexota bacterium]
MINLLLILVNYLSLAFSILLIAYVILSYFMDPYHPVRSTVDRMVNPILNPIRRIIPQTGMLDFSPLVALILVQIIEFILRSLILSLAS